MFPPQRFGAQALLMAARAGMDDRARGRAPPLAAAGTSALICNILCEYIVFLGMEYRVRGRRGARPLARG